MRRPLRLSRKVYRSCLLAALSAALLCIGIFAGFAYNQVCLENARNLREEAAYIAQAVELSGVAYLEKLSPEDGSRVTWIAADGQVLYDTWVPAEAMGNHGGRAEVRQALEEGSGQTIMLCGLRTVLWCDFPSPRRPTCLCCSRLLCPLWRLWPWWLG